MQWVRALFRTTRRLVGTDLDGNKYYEILQGKLSKLTQLSHYIVDSYWARQL